MDRWQLPLFLASLAVLAAAVVPQLSSAPLMTNVASPDVADAERAALNAPSDPHVWLALGDAYEGAGLSDAAWSAWSRAQRLAPDDPLVRARVARGPASVAPIERAVLESPQDDELWGDLGDHYEAMGDPRRAADAFRAALELDPQDGEWRESLTRLGYGGEVEQAVERMLSQDLTDDELVGDLADWLVEQGREAEALAKYEQARRMDPTDTEWLVAIARLRPERALSELPADLDDETLGDLADALMDAGQAYDACRLYRRAATLDPEDDEWTEALVGCP